MHRYPRLCPLAVLVGLAGSSVQADPPASSTSGAAIVETAQTGSTVPVSPTKPAPSIPPPRSDVGRFRRFTQTPATKPSAGRQLTTDAGIHRTQAGPGTMSAPIEPGIAPLPPAATGLSVESAAGVGSQSISLQAALYGAITSNPDLVTLRQGNALAASAESVEVARHFPTTLNPTLWMDYRPDHPDSRRHIWNDQPGGALQRQ